MVDVHLINILRGDVGDVVYDLHVLLAVLAFDHHFVVGWLCLLGLLFSWRVVLARATLVRIIVSLISLHVNFVAHLFADATRRSAIVGLLS